jgi:phosphatidylglycerol:prolipoprotein diacylglycerol transferase
MALVRIWAGFSSFGGFIGAIVGSLLFYGVVRRRSWWAHADVIMYGFPFAWIFGRLGCFIVHDHIGRPTTFPLAVHYPASMGGETRFDLGLNEALLAVVISVVFWVLGRKSRPGGFFLTVWCLLYAPVRFGFDFLRAAADDPHVAHPDVRWGALTPAQWGCILMFCAGLAGLARLRRLATAPVAEEGRTDSGSAAE